MVPELAEREIAVGYTKKGSNHEGQRLLAMPFRDQSWNWSVFLQYRNKKKKRMGSKTVDNTNLEVTTNSENHARLN